MANVTNKFEENLQFYPRNGNLTVKDNRNNNNTFKDIQNTYPEIDYSSFGAKNWNQYHPYDSSDFSILGANNNNNNMNNWEQMIRLQIN